MLAGTQLATTPLQVVGAGQPLQPIIQVQGFPPNAPSVVIVELSQFTLIFEGFPPGTVSVYVDSPAGQLIGTTTSTGTSPFTAPFVWPAVEGQHNVYAQEIVGAQTLHAECGVFGEPPAQ